MNHYRSARLCINRILSTHTSSGFCPDLEGFSSEICTSVSFHLCIRPTTGFDSHNPIRGILLLWPLFATASTTARGELRDRAEGYLGVIGEKIGVGQSLALLSLLKGKGGIPKSPVHKSQLLQELLQSKTWPQEVHDCFYTLGNDIRLERIYEWFEKNRKMNNVMAKDWKNSIRSTLRRHKHFIKKGDIWTDVTLPDNGKDLVHKSQLLQGMLQCKTWPQELHDCFQTLGNSISYQQIYKWFEGNGKTRGLKARDWKGTIRKTLSKRKDFTQDHMGIWSDASLGQRPQRLFPDEKAKHIEERQTISDHVKHRQVQNCLQRKSE
ncbi:hypothetical protein BJX99DRAFT_265727 [Aspergillus californicus]